MVFSVAELGVTRDRDAVALKVVVEINVIQAKLDISCRHVQLTSRLALAAGVELAITDGKTLRPYRQEM